MKRVVVAPATAHAFVLPEGGRWRVTDVAGTQVADVMVFSAANPLERFSQNVTRIMNWNARLGAGTTLYSSLQRPLAVIRVDTVGRHDTSFCSCSRYVYEEIYRVGPRPGCRDNIRAALDRLGGAPRIPEEMLTDPFNCFQNSGFDEDGRPYLGPAWSKPGDHIEFEALTDLVVAVSACPDDVSACNGNSCTPVELEIRGPGEGTRAARRG